MVSQPRLQPNPTHVVRCSGDPTHYRTLQFILLDYNQIQPAGIHYNLIAMKIRCGLNNTLKLLSPVS